MQRVCEEYRASFRRINVAARRIGRIDLARELAVRQYSLLMRLSLSFSLNDTE